MALQEPMQETPSVESLIEALQDKSSFVRVKAATALSALRDPRAVEPLAALLRHFDKNSQIAAAKALGEIGDPRAIEPLSAALGHESFETYDAIKEALTKLGAADAVATATASRAKTEAVQENKEVGNSLLLWGAGLLAIGLLCTFGSYGFASIKASNMAEVSGFGSAQYLVFTLPMVVGGIMLTVGFFRRQGAVNVGKIIASIAAGFFSFGAVVVGGGLMVDFASVPNIVQIPMILGMLVLAFVLAIRLSIRSWRDIIIVGIAAMMLLCLVSSFAPS
jgi:hypothetical protein